MNGLIPPHNHGERTKKEHLKDQLSRPATFEVAADIFKLLDDTSRLRIFQYLSVGRHDQSGCFSSLAAAKSKRPDRQPTGRKGSLL